MLTISDGKVILEAKEDRGKAEVEADTSGEVKTAVSARYLVQALKACGGMVELKVSSQSSPVMFTVDGYRFVVMPMMVEDVRPKEGAAQAEAVVEPEAQADEDEGIELSPDEAREPVAAA